MSIFNLARVKLFIHMYQRAYERGAQSAIAWVPVEVTRPPLALEWVLVAVKERSKGSPVVRCYTKRAMCTTVHNWWNNRRLQPIEYLAWTPIPKMPDYLRKRFQYEYDNPCVTDGD